MKYPLIESLGLKPLPDYLVKEMGVPIIYAADLEVFLAKSKRVSMREKIDYNSNTGRKYFEIANLDSIFPNETHTAFVFGIKPSAEPDTAEKLLSEMAQQPYDPELFFHYQQRARAILAKREK